MKCYFRYIANCLTNTGVPQVDDFQLKKSTLTTAVVTWEPLDDIDNYEILLQGQSTMIDADVTEHELHNLIPGKSYALEITAVKGNQRSKPTPCLFKTQGKVLFNIVIGIFLFNCIRFCMMFCKFNPFILDKLSFRPNC